MRKQRKGKPQTPRRTTMPPPPRQEDRTATGAPQPRPVTAPTPAPAPQNPAAQHPATPPPLPASASSAPESAKSPAPSAPPAAPPPTIQTPPPPPAPPVPAEPQQPPLLFEVGWEVCWQLGGIYTVLRTKAAEMVERWGQRYIMIGPYNPQTAALEFEEQPTEGIIRETLDRLRDQGIPCHFGRWLVPGRPQVILLDYRARYRHLDSDKYYLWADHGISTNASDGEVNEVTAFGFTVAEFFRQLAEVAPRQTVLAHFHEWMAGVAVPRIAHMKLPVGTVFTTHATLLGRYLAGDSPQFYNHLPFINGDEQAAKYNIYPRHAIEKAAAHASTVFTTVSEVTAFEAEKLLGRAPDAILPNGLNIHRFAALHEFQNLHRHFKEQIHEFVMGHFFPAYSFNVDNTLYFFTSGRYEYRNKGMDLYIEALARLNARLKQTPDAPTVVAFIITRAPTRSINVNALQNQRMFDELRNTCETISEAVGARLFRAAAAGRIPIFQELMPDDDMVRLKRNVHAWRSGRAPTIVTHDLLDDQNDPVLRHLRHVGLFNAQEDPVKIVFHPEFVTATSPLLSMEYDQFVRGCHMGIFPSYYEPWGYTPMESVALGVPAITTDLSGFGAYVERHIDQNEEQGIYVLNRRTDTFEQSADRLADCLHNFTRLSRRQRIELRNRVERLSEVFDWKNLIKYYEDAHNLALQRIGQSKVGTLEVRMV